MGYNQGDSYEEKIFQILESRKLLSPEAKRGGSSNQPDLIFLHQSRPSFLELTLHLPTLRALGGDSWFFTQI